MKVLYDHQIFTLQNYGGISRYFCEIIRNRPSNEEIKLSVVESDNIYLQEYFQMPSLKGKHLDYASFLNGNQFVGRYYTFYFLEKTQLLKTSRVINNRACIRDLKEKNYDIFHPTYYDDYFLPFLGKKPFVLTIHDMIPELFPDQFKYDDQARQKKKLAQKADAIIAVSENTKNDIVRILGIDPSKIHVIYHGGPKIEEASTTPIINKPYFLFVGRRPGYKNFNLTLYEFTEIHKKYPDISLVCTGDKLENEEVEIINKLGLKSAVIQLSAQDNILKNLYANALALIFPSKYEGFGLPILEAYAYGCPVVLNHTSCFPEIAGKAAVWFNESDSSFTLQKAMETIINLDNPGRIGLKQCGYERLKNFSWESSSKKLFEIYSSITGK